MEENHLTMQARKPELTIEHRVLDCLLQQQAGNARAALQRIEDLDFIHPANKLILTATREHVSACAHPDDHVDPEAVANLLAEHGHYANDEVRRVMALVIGARTTPAMLSQHIRALHIARIRRAAEAYALAISARAKDGDLEELVVMIHRYSDLERLVRRVDSTPRKKIHAA